MKKRRFLWEMHFHTRETSPCGSVGAGEGIERYYRSGYDGVVVTDHLRPDILDEYPGTVYDKANAWLRGYRTGKRKGDEVGFPVLLGAEIRLGVEGIWGDYLLYGFEETDVPEIMPLLAMSPCEVSKTVRARDWFMAQAHPFRDEMLRGNPMDLDGIEIYNGNVRQISRNECAEAYAQTHGLLGIGGSDFHELVDSGVSGTFFTRELTSSAGLAAALRERAVDGVLRAEVRVGSGERAKNEAL